MCILTLALQYSTIAPIGRGEKNEWHNVTIEQKGSDLGIQHRNTCADVDQPCHITETSLSSNFATLFSSFGALAAAFVDLYGTCEVCSSRLITGPTINQ